MFGMLKRLWLYRNFVYSSIVNEQKNQFINSKFGAIWMIMHPLSQVLIYALILSNVIRAKLPNVETQYAYAIYLIAGLLAWNLFSDIITRCLTIFSSRGNLLKKVNFPRVTLPAIIMGSSYFNNIILALVAFAVFFVLGHSFSWLMLLYIPLSMIVVLLAISIGLILGVLNVFVRDVEQVIPILLQIWFWFTPIVYPVAIIPEEYKDLLALNPFFFIVDGYQKALVFNQLPDFESLALILSGGLTFMVFSVFLFRRANAEMVDVL